MKNDIQEQDVIRLLERMKGQESAYPVGLHEKRREAFLMLGVSLLAAGTAGSIGGITGQIVHAAKLPVTLGTKIAIGIASTTFVGLSVYLGIAAYENRDAIRDFLQGSVPTITLVSPSPDKSGYETGTPTFIPTRTLIPTGTSTPTVVPTTTPTPKTISTSPNSGQSSQGGTPTKPGWHYGQTKTPKPKP